MRCPECRKPMVLAREEQGLRVWRCDPCFRKKRGVTKGEILMSWSVPMKLQEKGAPFLALLLALLFAASAQGAVFDKPSGTLLSCANGSCTTGCSRDGQTVGTGVSNAVGTQGTGSCASTSTLFDSLNADGASNIVFSVQNDTGNSVAITIERSIDGGTTYIPLTGTGTGTCTAAVGSQEWCEIIVGGSIGGSGQTAQPNGRFRAFANCTAGCHYLVKYHYVNAR